MRVGARVQRLMLRSTERRLRNLITQIRFSVAAARVITAYAMQAHARRRLAGQAAMQPPAAHGRVNPSGGAGTGAAVAADDADAAAAAAKDAAKAAAATDAAIASAPSLL